jgi:nucleotide-binding universal stress UspA family protein
MLQSVLIALDISPYSTPAMELGICWGKTLGALLVGLGVVDEPGIRRGERQSLGAGYYLREEDDQQVAVARRSVQEILEAFAARCDRAGVNCKLLEHVGMPYEEILRESQRYDLVLLNHEGHYHFGPVDRPDETLWKVLQHAPRPVVIAPPHLEAGSSVVLAYNGSPQADLALQAFQASGLDLGEEVRVLSVDADHEEAGRRADRAVEYLRLHKISAVAHAAKPTRPLAEMILNEVRRCNARLLVMGAYGHSTLHEFLLGSVTNQVVRDCPVPLFLRH